MVFDPFNFSPYVAKRFSESVLQFFSCILKQYLCLGPRLLLKFLRCCEEIGKTVDEFPLFLKYIGHLQGSTDLIPACTDFRACEMVLRARSCTQNYVCIKQLLWAQFCTRKMRARSSQCAQFVEPWSRKT